MEFVAEMPVLHIISNYRMKGQALLVPIEGNGRSNITLINPTFGLSFNGSLEKRNDGEEYYKIDKLKTTMIPKE